jgi:membrane-associated HD superfamily phosphohydrolase
MLELYEARGLKLGNISVTASKEIEDETIKQILEKIENMSHQDRNEFLAKLKYSDKEIQAINLYYEKLNKAKSIDNKPEESKDEDIWDTSDENIEEASSSLLKLIEDNEIKKNDRYKLKF